MSLIVRPAQAEDCACLAALAVSVWVDTYARQGLRGALSRYVLATFTADRFLALLEAPAKRLLVATQAGHVIGYALVDLDAPCPIARGGRVALETLYVSRRFQGQGVGRRLVDAASRIVGAQGALWLSCWVGNREAVDFYARLGFRIVGQTTFKLEHEEHANHIFVGSPAPFDSGK